MVQHPQGTVRLWRAPSGRLHWLRSCSGAAGPRNKLVTVTFEQFKIADRCRCVPEWKEFEVDRSS